MEDEAVAFSVSLSEPALSQGDPLFVLKHDDLFAVFDARGDFHGALHDVGPSIGADGVFQDDTRILSRLIMKLAGHAPQLLGGSIDPDNVVFSAHLTNESFEDERGIVVGASQLGLCRRRLLWDRKLYEALQVENYSPAPISTFIDFHVGADFCDVFEIRGATRLKRGELLKPQPYEEALTLSYKGLDGALRQTVISFSVPVVINERTIKMPIRLAAGRKHHSLMVITSEAEAAKPNRLAFLSALKSSKKSARRLVKAFNPISTSNAAFDAWLRRAAADLSLLVTNLQTGPYPYAGIPWFSAPFGRDAIVTAIQLLMVSPSLARGVLAHLSALQAAEASPFHDSEPGKIVHEIRKGEMAALEEVPFGRYYGGVDTTPLFVLLAGLYFKRTGDVLFANRIWPAVQAALDWIDSFGDRDGDGLIEYRRASEKGLSNQGWKDSRDSIFHADGQLAGGAIALVEVQAYVIAAKRGAANIAQAINRPDVAANLSEEATRLEQILNERFWCGPIGTYALALDGDKRQCQVRTSNPGHVLFCGAAPANRAIEVARGLMGAKLFSGWGIRTVALGEPRYNPMSYHNGTVWPHDCSLVAAGFARYGLAHYAERILSGLFDAACRFPEFRMPELFCGFARRAGEGPVSFPSACTPQAWSSGAAFLLLQSCLGIEIEAAEKTVRVTKPTMPDWLDQVSFRGIDVGTIKASISFIQSPSGVEVNIQGSNDLKLIHSP